MLIGRTIGSRETNLSKGVFKAVILRSSSISYVGRQVPICLLWNLRYNETTRDIRDPVCVSVYQYVLKVCTIDV